MVELHLCGLIIDTQMGYYWTSTPIELYMIRHLDYGLKWPRSYKVIIEVGLLQRSEHLVDIQAVLIDGIQPCPTSQDRVINLSGSFTIYSFSCYGFDQA